jgi:excisionase family DNA binding protein
MAASANRRRCKLPKGSQMSPKLISICPGATQRYSISRPTVYKLIKQGVLRPIKIGRSTRIDIAQADAAPGVTVA